MFNELPVLDVHAHVSHPMPGMGMLYMHLRATNGPIPSPIDAPSAGRYGLDRDSFAESVGRHVAYIDERQIEVQVIGPRPFLMLGDLPDYLLPSWTRAVNDAIALQCALYPDRFRGACQLPQNIHAPDASHCLEELRRCRTEYGFVGVYLSPDPEGRRNAPGLDDHWYDPLYAECESHAMPIVVHGTNCFDPRFKNVPHNYQLGFVAEQYWATQILSHGDVFDRFPGLKVVLCHCGGALDRWIPTDPHLAQRDLSSNLFFDTCAHDERYLECAIKQRGVAQMVFGTEAPGSGAAPRPSGSASRTGDDLVPVIAGFDFLTPEDKKAIFHDTPAALFPSMIGAAR